MTPSNKPENQKNHDSLSDLGQITQTPKKSKASCIIDAQIDVDMKAFNVDRSRAAYFALGYIAGLIESLTSADKDSREWAKKEVRRLAKLGETL